MKIDFTNKILSASLIVLGIIVSLIIIFEDHINKLCL